MRGWCTIRAARWTSSILRGQPRCTRPKEGKQRGCCWLLQQHSALYSAGGCSIQVGLLSTGRHVDKHECCHDHCCHVSALHMQVSRGRRSCWWW